MAKYTAEIAQQKLIDAGLENLTIVEYKGMNPKSVIHCSLCDRQFERSLTGVLGSKKKHPKSFGCENCSRTNAGLRRRERGIARFAEAVLRSPGISQLSPYTTAKAKVRMYHSECGRVFESTPDNMYGNQEKRDDVIRCPLCAIENNIGNQRSEVDFIEKFNAVLGDRFEYVGGYIKAHENAQFRCLKCKGIFERSPAGFMSAGYGCPLCSERAEKTPERFSKELLEKYGDAFMIIGEFKSMRTLIKIRHNQCQKIWSVRPDVLLYGSGVEYCPFCNARSGAEIELIRHLDDTDIDYEYQKKFSWCRDVFELPFDFYFPEYNIIIEIDGKQHETPIDAFGGVEAFKKLRTHDELKSRLAKEHGITVIRIPYDHGDTESVINEAFSILKLDKLKEA